MRRRTARELAVQCLYQMDMNDVAPMEAISTVLAEKSQSGDGPDFADGSKHTLDMADSVVFLKDLVIGTHTHRVWIDSVLERFLIGWRMERLSKVDRQILRLAVYELVFHEQTPEKVVINEAIEIAKYFGTEDSGKFVNGVLGKLVTELDEIKAHAPQKVNLTP